MAYRKGKFSWRAFVSTYSAWSALILLVSGIILYIAPAGRIAKWTHISLLGLEKDQWQAIHTVFSFLFIITIGFHLYYNWRPFLSYIGLRGKIKQFFFMRKELVATTLVTVIVFVLTLGQVPPFSTIMDIGTYFTESWESERTEPPIPHAEELTIGALAQTIHLPAEQLIQNLKQQGVEANASMVVKDVAQKYNLSPSQLFEKMKIESQQEAHALNRFYPGLGRKRLAELCKEINIPLDIALNRLKQFNIHTNGETTLRDLANQYDKKPLDILDIINKPQPVE